MENFATVKPCTLYMTLINCVKENKLNSFYNPESITQFPITFLILLLTLNLSMEKNKMIGNMYLDFKNCL